MESAKPPIKTEAGTLDNFSTTEKTAQGCS